MPKNLISRSELSESIYKQLSNQTGISIHLSIVQHAVEKSFQKYKLSYEDIKRSKTTLHTLLKNSLTIKQTELLNLIAKSLGHSKLESLKKSLTPKGSYITILDNLDTDYELPLWKDNPFMTLFLIKDDMFKLFEAHGINDFEFHLSTEKKEIQFWLKSKGKYLHSSKQKAMNAFFKSHGLTTYKNMVCIPWAFKMNECTPALEIIKKYHAFFYPAFNNREERLSKDATPLINYEEIREIGNSIVVDGYIYDMPHQTVTSVLECAFRSYNNHFWHDVTDILQATSMDSRRDIDYYVHGKRDIKDEPFMDKNSVPILIEEFESIQLLDKIKAYSFEQLKENYQDTIFNIQVNSTQKTIIKAFEGMRGQSIGIYIKKQALAYGAGLRSSDDKMNFLPSNQGDGIFNKIAKDLTFRSYKEIENADTLSALDVVNHLVVNHSLLIAGGVIPNPLKGNE